jgi:hypothetical protein
LLGGTIFLEPSSRRPTHSDAFGDIHGDKIATNGVAEHQLERAENFPGDGHGYAGVSEPIPKISDGPRGDLPERDGTNAAVERPQARGTLFVLVASGTDIVADVPRVSLVIAPRHSLAAVHARLAIGEE